MSNYFESMLGDDEDNFNGNRRKKSNGQKRLPAPNAAKIEGADARRPINGDSIMRSQKLSISITNANSGAGKVALFPATEYRETDPGHLLSGKFTNGDLMTVTSPTTNTNGSRLKRMFRLMEAGAVGILRTLELQTTQQLAQAALSLSHTRINQFLSDPGASDIPLNSFVNPANPTPGFFKPIPLDITLDPYNLLMIDVAGASTLTTTFVFDVRVQNSADDLQAALLR